MKKLFYMAGIAVSVILVVLSMTILGETNILAPVLIVLSIYLFAGCIIKLCKMNEKLKNTILCTIDLLWWLPQQNRTRKEDYVRADNVFKHQEYIVSEKAQMVFSVLFLCEINLQLTYMHFQN